MEPVRHEQASPGRAGLRALVELASREAAAQPERFVLPNDPGEAAALFGVGVVPPDRSSHPASAPLAVVGIVVAVYAGAITTMASGSAVGIWAALFVAMSCGAAVALFRLLTASRTGASARGRSISLSREDSKAVARKAVSAFADLLRADDCNADDAFSTYHAALVALARFELAAGQAVAADRDLCRLLPSDPLRRVAAQMAQDKALRAVTHRAAARAAADQLQAAVRARR